MSVRCLPTREESQEWLCRIASYTPRPCSIGRRTETGRRADMNPSSHLRMTWPRAIFRSLIPEAGKKAFWRYQETPRLVRNSWVWGIRRALLPYFMVRCWVKSIDGAIFFLGDDRIDDIILAD